ncbi:hypothetical protein [Gordonia sp. (in: high G+C Gram-positive bacteria)]|uniref:hypothetical protein n=1 Tax=Gordonia sp. (in: high G+C Gram-positive bacteria) TaxID=84139 RepID=UPI003F9E116F
MSNRIRTAGLTAATALFAAGAVLGTGQAAADPGYGDGFPGGPACAAQTFVKAESASSQIVICQNPGHAVDYTYKGLAKSTGETLVVPTARYASSGYHAFNNGYAYHVRPDALEILAPDGSVVSHEPWTYYDSTQG